MSKRILIVGAVTALGASVAHSAISTIEASWTGVQFSNTGFVTMQVDLDPELYDFDLGPGGGFDHSWWYSSFSAMTVVVTGSTTPLYNGTFYTDSMAWVRIYSTESTPTVALNTPGGAYADLGANYSVDYAPSDAGIGLLQLGAVGGAGDGEYVGSLGAAALPVPEPAMLSLLAGSVMVAVRRKPG